LFYAAIGQAGNGGEYWGFNGYEEPYDAAKRRADAGDRRLLQVDLSTPLGKRVTDIPISVFCDDLPFGRDLPSRPGTDELIHGADSVRLATEFALRYNNVIVFFTVDELPPTCYIQWGPYRSGVIPRRQQDWWPFIVIFFDVVFFSAVFALSTERRHFKRRMDFVQNRIKEREKILDGKEQAHKTLEE